MTQYWVVGGEYKDTRFKQLAPGAQMERHGPFASYKDAYAFWSARARATIDEATVRFRIVEEKENAA